MVGTILAVSAAWRWRDVRLSRRLARWGFLIIFVTPFAIMALPLTSMMGFSHLNLVVSMINQISGSFFLLAGLALLMVAPLVYLKRAKEVLRPHTPEEAAVFVRGARRRRRGERM